MEDTAENAGEQPGTLDDNDFHMRFPPQTIRVIPATTRITAENGTNIAGGSRQESRTPIPNAAAMRPMRFHLQHIMCITPDVSIAERGVRCACPAIIFPGGGCSDRTELRGETGTE